MSKLCFVFLQIVFDGSEATITYQCMKYRNTAVLIAPFEPKCAKHSCIERLIHHQDYDESVFTGIQDMNISNVFENCKDLNVTLVNNNGDNFYV